MDFLPYGRQLIDDDDIVAVTEALKSDYLTTGPATEAFEAALAERTGAAHAVSCSSGTAGLHLAALALGLGPGDSVVVPAITFLATANAARYVGADVVFADVDPDTGLMRGEDLEAALDRAGDNAKAVFPVHLAGQSPDLKTIGEIVKDRGLAVVEDSCHALGTITAANGGEDAAGGCRHSNMSVFSFHPVKTVAMGEGGSVTTNDPTLRDRLRLFRNHGMTRESMDFANDGLAFDAGGDGNPWFYEMVDMGFNYRASDIHCALGLSQLSKLDGFVAKRRQLAQHYDTLLAPLAPIVRPLGRAQGVTPAWHLYIVLIDFAGAGRSRADVMGALLEKGIGTQVHYIPVHTQPYYRNLYGVHGLPGAMAYYEQCLTLPLFVAMEESDVARVVDALTGIIGGSQ